MKPPTPTPIYRFIHVDNLATYLRRAGLHAPNQTPNDGLPYKTIHNVSIQGVRRTTAIECGPGGVIHDYVPFYFGVHSPMLLNLHTGRVPGYGEGQEPLIYLVTTAQAVAAGGCRFVLSDGHGIAGYTDWFDDLADLDKVDWATVRLKYWADTVDDMDRQRRKQAEFLIHRFCSWDLVQEIGVLNDAMKAKAQSVLGQFPASMARPVSVHRDWYY
jgi:hypothetical protein